MSITINGTSHLGDYVNISSDFEEQPGAVLRINPWGLDTISRKFNGPLSSVETELDKLESKRNYRDAFYTFMHATDWTVTHDAPFPTLEISFIGIRGGKPRDPETVTGSRIQSVTLQFTGDTPGESDGTTATLKYRAPYATCKYATKSRVDAPKYTNKVRLGAIQIIAITGDATKDFNFKKGASFNGATSSSTVLTGLANTFNATVELSGSVESRPVGQWFENTETIEALITPLGLTLNKRVVSVS